MLDIQLLRKDIDAVASASPRAVFNSMWPCSRPEAERKQLQTQTEDLQARRNSLSKQIGMLKGKGEDASGPMAEVAGIGDTLKASAQRLAEIQDQISDAMLSIPNLPHESVPTGKDETENVEVRRVGTPRTFDFEIKDHVDVGARLGLDFETATKVTGSRFAFLRGGVARMHRALVQFMVDTHTLEHGYTEMYVPYIVNAASMRGTGQLPKFEDDLFKVPRKVGGEDGQDAIENFYLIPTAEVPLTNMVRDAIVAAEKLPLRFVAHTPCFRSKPARTARTRAA
jgi:seryl-tRNA synthetase